jgi:hypothetical protein
MKTETPRYYIDSEQLRKWDACEEEHQHFLRVFPGGRMDVTRDNIERAIREHLPLRWPAVNLHGAAAALGDLPISHRAFDLYKTLRDTEDYVSTATEAFGAMQELGDLFAKFKAKHPDYMP